MRLIVSFLLVIYLLTLLSCATKAEKESHPQLANSRITPRPGYEGYLTHKNSFGHVKKYKLDEDFIKLSQELKIACNVAGKRYRVCHDRLGLCRTEKKEIVRRVLNLFKKTEYKIEKSFIPFSSYGFLIEANTFCRSGL